VSPSILYLCQIYAFGSVKVLLQALVDQKTPSNEELQQSASGAVKAMVHFYGLSTDELEALAGPGESVERLKAMLIMEHNKVGGLQSANTPLQILSRFRNTIATDAQNNDELMPQIVSEVPMKIQQEIKTWSNMGSSQFYKKLAVALLPERSYQLVVAIIQDEMDKNFEKQARQRQSGDAAVKELPIKLGGLEALVAEVDQEGIFNVLKEVKRGTRDLNSVKQWVAKWRKKKSTCPCDLSLCSFY
jgi:hypothetical protein